MNKKLIAIDIDDTLLTSQRQLLPETAEAIKEAKAAGHKIVITSGRPLVGIKPILQELNLDDLDDEYVIAYNGEMSATTAGKVLTKASLSFGDYQTIYDFAQQEKIPMILQSDRIIYTSEHFINLYASLNSYKNRMPIQIASFDEMKAKQEQINFFKILFLDEADKLDQCEKDLPRAMKEKYNIIRTETFSLDFIPAHINKGTALKALAKKLGFAQADTIALGNSNNDISMVQYAGIGIAVNNSTPALLQVADQVTASNNDDGVGKALRKILKL